MRSRIAVIVAFAMLLMSTAMGSEKPFVRVHWKGETMRVRYKGTTMTYHLQPDQGLQSLSGYDEVSIGEITQIRTDYLEEKKASSTCFWTWRGIPEAAATNRDYAARVLRKPRACSFSMQRER